MATPGLSATAAPGVAWIDAERMSSGWLMRSVGYDVSRFDGLVAGRPSALIATPSPDGTISRQPIRSGYEVSVNVTVAGPVSAAASGAVNAHSIRIVESPPAPGGNGIAARRALGTA